MTMVDTLGDFHAALNRTLADLDLPPVDKTPISARWARARST
jgi:phosphoglycolate phosphatase